MISAQDIVSPINIDNLRNLLRPIESTNILEIFGRDEVSYKNRIFTESDGRSKLFPYEIPFLPKISRSRRIAMRQKRKRMEEDESLVSDDSIGRSKISSVKIKKNNIKLSTTSIVSMEENLDISVFYTTNSSEQSLSDGRKTNGAKNEIRERIIELLVDLPEKYTHDSRWIELRDKFYTAVRTISPYTNYTFCVYKRGGRNYSYDFDFVFTNIQEADESDAQVAESYKIEFKFSNTSTIDNLPQVYQKSCNTTDIFIHPTNSADGSYELFPAYYYKNGLVAYCDTDDALRDISRPILEEYIKKSASNASTDPFFVELKNRSTFHESEKNKVVNSTIESYIRESVNTIDLAKVSDILQSTQAGKTYLIWNYKTLEFHIRQIPAEELVITRVASVSKNTIVFQAKQYTYPFLLRWKNRKGILNPAWQVSLKISKPAKPPKLPKTPKPAKIPKPTKIPKPAKPSKPLKSPKTQKQPKTK